MVKYSTADLKWARRIRERDGSCQICGKTGKYLNAHHLVPRQFLEFRHNMDNGITLCVHCHNFGKFSAHKNPLWFARWLMINKSDMYLLAAERINKSWIKLEK